MKDTFTFNFQNVMHFLNKYFFYWFRKYLPLPLVYKNEVTFPLNRQIEDFIKNFSAVYLESFGYWKQYIKEQSMLPNGLVYLIQFFFLKINFSMNYQETPFGTIEVRENWKVSPLNPLYRKFLPVINLLVSKIQANHLLHIRKFYYQNPLKNISLQKNNRLNVKVEGKNISIVEFFDNESLLTSQSSSLWKLNGNLRCLLLILEIRSITVKNIFTDYFAGELPRAGFLFIRQNSNTTNDLNRITWLPSGFYSNSANMHKLNKKYFHLENLKPENVNTLFIRELMLNSNKDIPIQPTSSLSFSLPDILKITNYDSLYKMVTTNTRNGIFINHAKLEL